VVRALEHCKRERWREIRTLDDLETVFSRFLDTKEGDIALAQYLWDCRQRLVGRAIGWGDRVMGPVETAVRAALRPGQELRTPGEGAPFTVGRLNSTGLVLLLGRKKAWTPIR
jgi:hypothetical protein